MTPQPVRGGSAAASAALCLLAALGAAAPVHATEGGSTYPAGVENFLAGAAPPPGFYVLEYVNLYSADRVRDGAGNRAPVPGFKLDAKAFATRFVWSSPIAVAGGNLLLHSIVPLVDLSVSVAGTTQDKTGLGDATFGAAVAWHHSPALHSVLALDLVAPTGRYKKGDQTNIGANHWSVQPLMAVSLINPAGFNADLKATLNLNQRNSDTDYRSGTEFIADYAAGWGLGNGWTLGVGGYWKRQLNDDRQRGVDLAGSKSHGMAIGPSVRYDNGKGWFITAKFTHETGVRNGPQGNAFWLKTLIPF